MGFLDWMKRGKPPDTHHDSVASKFVISTQTEKALDDSLREMSFMVDCMLRSDPAHHNWHKFAGDFENAVKGVNRALKTYDRERKAQTRHDYDPER
jgi:hypothetical protein